MRSKGGNRTCRRDATVVDQGDENGSFRNSEACINVVVYRLKMEESIYMLCSWKH